MNADYREPGLFSRVSDRLMDYVHDIGRRVSGRSRGIGRDMGGYGEGLWSSNRAALQRQTHKS